MKFLATLAAIVAIALNQADLASSHGGVIGYKISNTYYKGFLAYNTPVGQSSIQREWDSYDPITNPTDGSISCNKNGATLGSGQLSATAAAGSQVTAYWNQWPHTIGPVMVYMARCPSTCASATPSSLSWFKIDQGGLISGTLPSGTWAMGQLVANNNSWYETLGCVGYGFMQAADEYDRTTTIPGSLAAGEYMIRHELLAIHTSNQAQFYPECAHLKLTGGGSAQPSGSYLVKFPGAYKASDPGVTLDIYSQPTVTNYTIPGPAVWRG